MVVFTFIPLLYINADKVKGLGEGEGGADGEQGWRSGESARLPPVCPGFGSWTRCYMWAEFVVGSLLCSERLFSGYSGFSPECTGIF